MSDLRAELQNSLTSNASEAIGSQADGSSQNNKSNDYRSRSRSRSDPRSRRSKSHSRDEHRLRNDNPCLTCRSDRRETPRRARKRRVWVHQQQLAVPHGTVGQPSFGGLKHAPSHIFDTTTQATQSRAVIANADLPNVDAPPKAWCEPLVHSQMRKLITSCGRLNSQLGAPKREHRNW